MNIINKIVYRLIYRSKISHYFFTNKVDHFFETIEYQSLEKKNMEEKNQYFG